MTRWNVLCRVWGGVTGSRQSLLKTGAGEIQFFDTEQQAAAKANELNDCMNKGPRRANFAYSLIPALSEDRCAERRG